MSLTIDGQANSITSSTAGVNIPATVDTLSVGPSGSYMIANSSGVGIGTLTPQTTTHILGQNPVLKLQGTASTSGISGVELHANNNRWRIRADNNTSQNYFVIEDYAGGSNTNRLLIDSAGRVTMPYQPSFFAYKTGGDSTTNVGSIIVFDGTAHNIGSNYNTSTGKFTAPVTGVYAFHAQIWAKNATTIARTQFFVNSSNVTQNGMNPASINLSDHTYQMSMVRSLSANDTVDIRVDSANLTYYGGGGSSHSYFSGYLIG